jgi:hypothetical protein
MFPRAACQCFELNIYTGLICAKKEELQCYSEPGVIRHIRPFLLGHLLLSSHNRFLGHPSTSSVTYCCPHTTAFGSPIHFFGHLLLSSPIHFLGHPSTSSVTYCCPHTTAFGSPIHFFGHLLLSSPIHFLGHTSTSWVTHPLLGSPIAVLTQPLFGSPIHFFGHLLLSSHNRFLGHLLMSSLIYFLAPGQPLVTSHTQQLGNN